MWCKDCRTQRTPSMHDAERCADCVITLRERRVGELESIAPNGGRAEFNTTREDHNFLYFKTKADAVAFHAKKGADIGPRESKKHAGMWYLTYSL